MIRVVGVVTGRGRSMDDTMTRDAAPMGAGWGWLLAYGLLSLILGVAAFLWPFSATIAATLIIGAFRSEEHTSELQSLMRSSYAVFCLKKKTHTKTKILHQLSSSATNINTTTHK